MSGASETDPGLCRYRLQRESFSLDVDLVLPPRGITGVFGRSGAGKTTLLRCIAGLEPEATGYLRVAGDVWEDSAQRVRSAPHARRAACVFQDGRLFPHLSVAGNLRFGLKRSRASGGPAWREVIELLDLAPLLARGTRELSGGEQQRVAIGRALLQSPRLILFDEPLASLDAQHKQQILPFLDRLHSRLSLPMLYVSHSLEELIALCDYLVVMEQGRVVAAGELAELLARVDVPGLAGDETGALVSAAITDYDEAYDLTRLAFPGGELTVPGRHPPGRGRVRARILARDVSISLARPDASSILNVVPAVVREIGRFSGPFVTVRVAAGQTDLLARITRRSLDELNLRPGQSVFAQVKAVAVKSFGLHGH